MYTCTYRCIDVCPYMLYAYIYTNTQIMQTATANNINFTNSAARNAPDKQKSVGQRARVGGRGTGSEQERGRACVGDAKATTMKVFESTVA